MDFWKDKRKISKIIYTSLATTQKRRSLLNRNSVRTFIYRSYIIYPIIIRLNNIFINEYIFNKIEKIFIFSRNIVYFSNFINFEKLYSIQFFELFFGNIWIDIEFVNIQLNLTASFSFFSFNIKFIQFFV